MTKEVRIPVEVTPEYLDKDKRFVRFHFTKPENVPDTFSFEISLGDETKGELIYED